MRNLKRALSLTLASVMLLGMMVVGTSAAGYDDVKETDNVEAIEVLQAIEVMVGDERGFGPDRPVNRAEMAVVMGKLLSLDYNYYATSCPFNDVYDWARGYVGACYANKIVSGRGDGVYDPGATVTAVEAASMLMRALGYFQYANDVADGFELSTVRQGTKIGIFDGVGSSATEPMTRNQVAQMVLNALQSDTVEPDGNTINLTTPDGTVLTGKVNYVSVTRDEAFATAISRTQATSVGSKNDGWIVELGERLYNGDLKLYEYTDDEFMRPSRTWEYDGKEIGTYMKKENIRAEYTAAVTDRTLYDLLGRTILQDYDFAYYVDGVLTDDTSAEILTRKTSDYLNTGRGVLTQVFVDVEAETIDITSINTYLAKAAVDYNKTTESVSLNVYGSITETATSPLTYRTDSYNKTVSLIDVPEIENVKQDQYLLVNVSGKDSANLVRKTLTGYDVVAVSEPEILSDSTLTKFSKRDSDAKTDSDEDHALFKNVTTGGTEYQNSTMAYYSDDVLDLYDDDRLVNKTYNVYLDKYGYAIGIDLHEGDDNYVFITGFDPSGSNIAYGNADAAAIFTDGTMKVIKVDTKATNTNIDKVDDSTISKSYFEQWNNGMWANKYALNRWFTYTVDKDGVYTLHPAQRMITTEVVKTVAPADANGLTIKTSSVRIDEKAAVAEGATNKNGAGSGSTGTRTYGNDDSVYIVVDTGDIDNVDNSGRQTVITEVSGVYTGVQNVEIDVVSKPSTDAGKVISGTALYDSIYTVYDKNNYIIASVVIGEAKGGNANYAYILTAATFEERVGDNTVWGFDAIVDGKVAHLTTSSKFSKVISALEPGHVQELRYTGDYVSGVKTPDKASQYWDYEDATSNKYMSDKVEIYDVGHGYGTTARTNDCASGNGHTNTYTDAADYKTQDGNKVWIKNEGHLGYETVGDKKIYQANDLKIIGNTMYFRTQNETVGSAYKKDTGLAFLKDAPAVVIHKVDGSTKKVECSSVAQAIAELGDPEKTTSEKEFAGRIVAVLNSQGAAKWVVFISDTEVKTKGIDYVGPGQKVENVELTAGNRLVVTANTDDGTDAAKVRVPAVTWLQNNGYTVSTVTAAKGGILDDPQNDNLLIEARDSNGNLVYFNTDLKCMVNFTLNGTNVSRRLGETVTATNYLAGASVAVGGTTAPNAGNYTVAWTNNGQKVLTDLIKVQENGGTAKYWQVGNEITLTSAEGNWYQYDTTKYAPVSEGKITVTADMDNKDLLKGYFKISVQGDATKVDYVKDNATTTVKVAGLTGAWAKTSDDEFVAVIAGGKINPADLTGATDAIDDDITIVDSGFYKVAGGQVDKTTAGKLVAAATGTFTTAFKASASTGVTKSGTDYYVKKGSVLAIEITVDTAHTSAEDLYVTGTGFTKSDKVEVAASAEAGTKYTATITAEDTIAADVSTLTWSAT